jgi:flagellar basal body-associated protein FliL
MNRKIFFIVIFAFCVVFMFSLSGCLSLFKSKGETYVGTSEISYSVEQGTVKTGKVSGNIFWYDPFGTISSTVRDEKVCEIEISIGYDSADRDFLLQFTKKRMDVFNEVVKYLSKQNSKYLVIENADNIEEELFSVINKICKDTCPIYQIKIIRLETF